MTWLQNISSLFRNRRDTPLSPLDPSAVSRPASRDEVLRSLQAFLAGRSRSRLSVESIDPAMSMLDSGYVDSLGLVDLLNFVEKTYSIADIPQIDLIGRLGTLDALSTFLYERSTTGE